MTPVAGKVDMVDPNLRSFLNTDCVAGACQDLADADITDNHVGGVIDTKPDTVEGCFEIFEIPNDYIDFLNSLAPDLPKTDVLLPTRTTALPLMVPGIE